MRLAESFPDGIFCPVPGDHLEQHSLTYLTHLFPGPPVFELNLEHHSLFFVKIVDEGPAIRGGLLREPSSERSRIRVQKKILLSGNFVSPESVQVQLFWFTENDQDSTAQRGRSLYIRPRKQFIGKRDAALQFFPERDAASTVVGADERSSFFVIGDLFPCNPFRLGEKVRFRSLVPLSIGEQRIRQTQQDEKLNQSTNHRFIVGSLRRLIYPPEE
jgi:hypothetical protein